MKWVIAYGPACLGNLAAGFDVLGAALAPDLAYLPAAVRPGTGEEAIADSRDRLAAAAADPGLWGDLVEVAEPSAAPVGWAPGRDGPVQLQCSGPYADQLPADPAHNLALRAYEAFARRLGSPLPPFAMHLRKGLPVGSGLGSSSATVVAALRALNAWSGQALNDAALLAAAGEAEAHAAGAAHLDNVAAALLGGLRLVDPGGGARRLPFPTGLRFVVASPALTLATRAARAALPAVVPFGVAVSHAQNLASLVHALHAVHELDCTAAAPAASRAAFPGPPGSDLMAAAPPPDSVAAARLDMPAGSDLPPGAPGGEDSPADLLRACLRDLLAEPYREKLVPGFRGVQSAALAAGAWGCSLSGAGPAIFALATVAAAPAVGAAMRRAWLAAGIASRWRVCTLDARGARVVAASP